MSRPALLMILLMSAFSAHSAALAVLSASSAAVLAAAPTQMTFTAKDAGEAIATVTASCEQCDWGVEGREAATLRVSLDGTYSQHLRAGARRQAVGVPTSPSGGSSPATHSLSVDTDDSLSAKGIGAVAVRGIKAEVIPVRTDEQRRTVDGAHSVRTAKHGRQVHRRARVHVVRDRARARRPPVPLLRDLHE